MSKKLLLLLLSFLIFGFMTSFAQEDDEPEIQAIQNPNFTQSTSQSIFEDASPLYGSQWEWLHATPQGNTLREVKMWDADNWYAVGYGGTFMKTADAGATWTVVKTANGVDNNGSNEIVYDLHFWDMNTGLICGGYGSLYRTTDGGLNWDSLYNFSTTGSVYEFEFLNDTLGFISGSSSIRVQKTTDGGNSWTPIWGNMASRTCYTIYAVDENNLKVACSGGYFLTTTDGGTNWTEIDLGGTLYDMEFTDPMNGWVCGTDNNPEYTTDGGVTWTSTPTSPTSSTMYDIDIMSTMSQTLNEDFTSTTFPPTGWHAKNLLGSNDWYRYTTSYNSPPACARISYQSTGGEDWLVTPQVSIVAADTLKFWARKYYTSTYIPDSLYILVSTTDTTVASFTNVVAGFDVNAMTTTFTEFAVDLSAFAGMSIYIAFRHIDTDGNGMMLDDVTIGEPMSVDQVFVTGNSFNIFATTDMGTTWTPVDFLGATQSWTGTYYATDFLADNHFVTVGLRGHINQVTPTEAITYHTTYIRAGTIYAMWAQSESGRVIAGGAASLTTTFDQAIYSTDGGETWALSVVEDSIDFDFNSISMVDTLTGYAAREDHYVSKTTDGGATWFPVTRVASLTSDLETCSFVDENTGYVYGASGLGYKTTDGGTTWTPLTTGHGSTSIFCSFFLDASTGFTGGDGGLLYKTTDGGATTTPLTPGVGTTDINGIWFVNNNIGYICCDDDIVVKTTDGGATWTNVDPGTTTLDLFCIEFTNEMNGMTAGSSGRTFYTNDGGITWNFENNSMSTIYAMSLERSSLDTSAAYIGGLYSHIMRNSHVIVPVELASFTASVSGNSVTLNWVTATELNNLGFDVERKAEEEDWAKIGFVDGHGTTTEPQIYNFKDVDLTSGTYNYRVKQIDYDGSYRYYNLAEAVEVGAPVTYDLSQNYPNPFNPTTKIKYSVPADGFVNITVYNVLGEKVADIVNNVQKAGRYEVTFDATNIASGMYIYRMESGDFVSVKKMMILK